MWRDFLSYYRPHTRLFSWVFGAAIISGVLELAFPLAIAAFIDTLLPAGNMSVIIWAAAGLLGVYVLNTALMGIVTYWGHKLGIEIETQMRARAFEHLTRLSWGWFDRKHTGKLAARVTRDLEEVGEVAHHGPEDLFIAVMTFVGAFALMVMIHPLLAVVTGVIVPLTSWIVVFYGGRMTRAWQDIYARVGRFNMRLEESLGGIRVVQSFGNEDHERRLFERDNHAYRTTKLAAYRIMAVSTAINYLGLRFVQLVVMVLGAGFVLQSSLSAGGFVGFLLLVGVFVRPLDKIAAVIETYPRGIAGFRRYQDLLATRADIVDMPHACDADGMKGDISFRDVCFGYDPARPVLRDISFTVAAGQTIAFVGPSGAGKSTLLALLPRFYEPQSGQIAIDGRPLDGINLSSLRRQIGLVSQDVFLFGTTLRENIAYGNLEATESEILEAARRAQLGDVLETLPQGLDTPIGERGVMLSGGQKQRVAIARAFLKDPPILILDEATSALDSETETLVQNALEDLSSGRTTLVIAHRLRTIRNADRIIVMDGGRIAEIGAHEALLGRGGLYARLAS